MIAIMEMSFLLNNSQRGPLSGPNKDAADAARAIFCLVGLFATPVFALYWSRWEAFTEGNPILNNIGISAMIVCLGHDQDFMNSASPEYIWPFNLANCTVRFCFSKLYDD
jgi:hypothetical protein